MGYFNSDDSYIYYCVQELLRRNGVALIVNKSLKCSTQAQSQKWQNDLSLFPRQTIQHHSNPSLYPNHWCQRSWSWLVSWRPTTPSRTNSKIKKKKKRYLFHHRGLECRRRKSRDTLNNMQVWLWSTKWSRAKAHSFSKHPFPTIQEMTLHMDITRWSKPKSGWLCPLQPKMEKL